RSSSEVVVVDVLGVEDGGRAEDDLAARADRALAELAGLELLALGSGDLAGRQRRRRVGGQVAEGLGGPQREFLDRAVLDELAYPVGGVEACQPILAPGDEGDVGAGRGGEAAGGRRADALEVGARPQQALRLPARLLVVVVAGGGLDELHLRLLR